MSTPSNSANSSPKKRVTRKKSVMNTLTDLFKPPPDNENSPRKVTPPAWNWFGTLRGSSKKPYGSPSYATMRGHSESPKKIKPGELMSLHLWSPLFLTI